MPTKRGVAVYPLRGVAVSPPKRCGCVPLRGVAMLPLGLWLCAHPRGVAVCTPRGVVGCPQRCMAVCSPAVGGPRLTAKFKFQVMAKQIKNFERA